MCVCVCYGNLMTFNYITIKHLRHCKRIRNVKSYNGKYAHTQWLWWWYGSGAEATAWLLFCRQMFCVAKNAGRRTHIHIWRFMPTCIFQHAVCWIVTEMEKKLCWHNGNLLFMTWVFFRYRVSKQNLVNEREREGFFRFSRLAYFTFNADADLCSVFVSHCANKKDFSSGQMFYAALKNISGLRSYEFYSVFYWSNNCSCRFKWMLLFNGIIMNDGQHPEELSVQIGLVSMSVFSLFRAF